MDFDLIHYLFFKDAPFFIRIFYQVFFEGDEEEVFVPEGIDVSYSGTVKLQHTFSFYCIRDPRPIKAPDICPFPPFPANLRFCINEKKDRMQSFMCFDIFF